MFDNVLLPTPPDGTHHRLGAFGVTLAETFGADVVLLSVLDRPQRRDQIRADFEETARESTDPIMDLAADRGLSTDRVIESGEVPEEILQTVEDRNIDLIVMGTHARTGVDRMVLGSVAEAVIRESPVPVLTVTPDAEVVETHEPGP